MNSYLMGFTQFILLRLREKCNESAEISKQRRWDFNTGKERKRCHLFCFFPCSLQESSDFNAVFTKAIIYLFFFHFVTSIHVQFIQKGETAFTQSQSQYSGSQLLLFYNRTITIFMRSPADGKTISLFFCGPHSFYGLILMKSVVVNR